jgi:hypothetical protein
VGDAAVIEANRVNLSASGLGREKVRARSDPEPRQVETIGVPATADSRIIRHEAVGVASTGIYERVFLALGDRELD